MSSFLFGFSMLFFAFGAFCVTATAWIVEGLRERGRLPADGPRDQQQDRVRFVGWGSVVIGFGIVCFAAVII